MAAATQQTYLVQTGVMYTNDQLAGVSSQKTVSITRTIPSNATVTEYVQTHETFTEDAQINNTNDVFDQYSTVTVVGAPTQPRLNY